MYHINSSLLFPALVDSFDEAQWQQWRADARANGVRPVDTNEPQIQRGRRVLELLPADYADQLWYWVVSIPGVSDGNRDTSTWLLLRLLSLLGNLSNIIYY